MTFHSIFSKKTPSKINSPNIISKPIPKIEIDYREKNSLVPSILKNLQLEIEIKELKVADYIVNGTAIERKTIDDFLQSMINRRLINQLEELQQYPNRLLIIEGLEEQELYNDFDQGINGNAIRGFILTILLKYKTPIIYTKNPKDTAQFIYLLSKKQDKELPLNPKKKSHNKKEQKQYIMESFPGIGPKTAKKLLEKHKTLKQIINLSNEELKKNLGKKSQSFKQLIEENY